MNAKTAFHALALAACFTAHFAFAEELDGVRRAMQTIATAEGQTKVAAVPAVVQVSR